MPAQPSTPPSWVLDTNVVLDWLVFDDPRLPPLVARIAAGAARWVYSPAMLDETLDVVARPEFRRWGEAAMLQSRVDAAYRRHGSCFEAASAPALRCRDGDDQMFIDLALQWRCQLLLSRDKALLELARAARGRGLTIARPAELTVADLPPLQTDCVRPDQTISPIPIAISGSDSS